MARKWNRCENFNCFYFIECLAKPALEQPLRDISHSRRLDTLFRFKLIMDEENYLSLVGLLFEGQDSSECDK